MFYEKTIATITLAIILSCSCISILQPTAYAKSINTDDAGIISIFSNKQASDENNKNTSLTKTASYHHVKNLSNLDRMFLTAVQQEDYEAMQEMIDNGVDINGVFPTSYRGQTAFLTALDNNNRTMMQFILERGGDITGYYDYDLFHRSYLVKVTQKQDLELIKYPHNWGARINEYDYNSGCGKINALHILSHHTYLNNLSVDIVSYLIEQGIDINQIDKNNCTPLMYFCNKRNIHPQIIQALFRCWS